MTSTHVFKKEDDLSKQWTTTELGKRIKIPLKSKPGELHCGACIENRTDYDMGPIHVFEKNQFVGG